VKVPGLVAGVEVEVDLSHFFTWLLLVLLGVGYVICGGARG
jgi:hypothetical protein